MLLRPTPMLLRASITPSSCNPIQYDMIILVSSSQCVYTLVQLRVFFIKKSVKVRTRTIIVHRSVDGIITVINICSVRQKDGKKSRLMD